MASCYEESSCAKFARSAYPSALHKIWYHTSVSMEITVWEDRQADLPTPRVRAEYVRGLRGKDSVLPSVVYLFYG